MYQRSALVRKKNGGPFVKYWRVPQWADLLTDGDVIKSQLLSPYYSPTTRMRDPLLLLLSSSFLYFFIKNVMKAIVTLDFFSQNVYDFFMFSFF